MKEEGDRVEQIIRASVVNFKRKNSKLNLQMAPTPFQRSTTTGKEREKKSKVEGLNEAEKLILYFASNLFLFRELDSTVTLLVDYGLKISNIPIYKGNVYKLLGLVYYYQHRHAEALDCLEKANSFFEQGKSQYGQGLCSFALGYVYCSRVAQFNTTMEEGDTYAKAKELVE